MKTLCTILAAVLCSITAHSQQTIKHDLSASAGSKCIISDTVPDGNYRVTVTFGNRKKAGSTTLRAESRRLLAENIITRKNEFITRSFIVNKHSPYISEKESVRIKEREKTKKNWDTVLSLEITGDNPMIKEITIEPDTTAPTIYLCGNSTVVDQDEEPWASWGQMLPRFLGDSISVANYAESGETASTFCQVGRFKRILKDLREGDFVVMEFGHNDQKQKFPGAGAYYNFTHTLKTMIDEIRARKATPILISPTQRRFFKDGKIQETHADYPEAMEWLANKEKVLFIDLHSYTRDMFETWGEEGSKRAFVHYPANSYPGQTKALADNTHFNPYGAYEIAKCVLHGMRDKGILTQYFRDFDDFDPKHPDPLESFHWTDSENIDILKPDGN